MPSLNDRSVEISESPPVSPLGETLAPPTPSEVRSKSLTQTVNVTSPNDGKVLLRNLIVVPAFNEEEALPSTLADLSKLPANYDVLIIDDGSKDSTCSTARAIGAAQREREIRVVRLPVNSGIGAAVQTGYMYAASTERYEFVIQCDADGQHDPIDIPRIVDACRERNLDLCIGSRVLEDLGDRSTFMRRVGIRFFVRLINFLSGAGVTDPTSGLRCSGPRAWRRFARSYPEDYPEPESLYWCVRNGLNVGEVPVRMRPRETGVSSIRYWKTCYYMVKVTLAILVDHVRDKDQI